MQELSIPGVTWSQLGSSQIHRVHDVSAQGKWGLIACR